MAAVPSQEGAMPTVHIRLTGSESSVGAMIHALESIEGIEHVEEVADLMPHLDDDDSSSAGLSDLAGPTVHDIEVLAPNDEGVRRVHDTAEDMARQLDAIVEFVVEF
jgi:hypothetical protein